MQQKKKRDSYLPQLPAVVPMFEERETLTQVDTQEESINQVLDHGIDILLKEYEVMSSAPTCKPFFRSS